LKSFRGAKTPNRPLQDFPAKSHFFQIYSGSFRTSIGPEPDVGKTDLTEIIAVDLIDREMYRTLRLDHFWKLWSSDLRNLPPAPSKFSKRGNGLTVGDVILIREDNVPRLGWPLARVVEIFSGIDDNIRREPRVN
jgi:hypothetical protein